MTQGALYPSARLIAGLRVGLSQAQPLHVLVQTRDGRHGEVKREKNSRKRGKWTRRVGRIIGEGCRLMSRRRSWLGPTPAGPLAAQQWGRLPAGMSRPALWSGNNKFRHQALLELVQSRAGNSSLLRQPKSRAVARAPSSQSLLRSASAMPQPGQIKQWWYKWKALELPWRKKVLRGKQRNQFCRRISPSSTLGPSNLTHFKQRATFC